MRHEQFDESVKRSLYNAAHRLELYETKRLLENDAKEAEKNDLLNRQGIEVITRQYEFKSDGKVSSFGMRTIVQRPKQEQPNIPETSRSLQEIIRNRYIHQRALMDEVVYKMLYTPSNLPLEQRIDFQALNRDLQAELLHNGIEIPYHFTIHTSNGREIYRSDNYKAGSEKGAYSQILFGNDPPSKMGLLKINFPTLNSYIFSSVRFMIPALFFTIVLCIAFVYTLYIVLRQKKVTELKK